MTTLTITVGDQLEAFIRRFGQEKGLSPEAAAVELLRRTARVEEMDTLRERLSPYFDEAGVKTEEDVEHLVRRLRDEHKAGPDT